MQDRRHEQRFDLRLPCLVNILEQNLDKELYQMETLNISHSGAYLLTSAPLSVGTRIAADVLVRLDAPSDCKTNGSCISLNGEVLRSDPEGMAVIFAGPYRITSIDRLIAASQTRAQWFESVAKCSLAARKSSMRQSRSDRIRHSRNLQSKQRHHAAPPENQLINTL